jgi:CheY-like chemotaxis protein
MVRRMPLLIVDDDTVVRDMLQSAFSTDCDVLLASDGEDALHCYLAHAGQIDAVLADVNMPQVNGAELLAWLRNQPARVPVLLISANATQLALAGRGRVACLMKPFTIAAVRHAVEGLLQTGAASP